MGDPLAEWTSSSISGSLHKLTLAKLQPDSLYEVEMTAKNCAGLGQPAMMTFRTGKSKTLLRTVIEWSEMLKVYVFSRTNELEAESLGSWKVLGDGLR